MFEISISKIVVALTVLLDIVQVLAYVILFLKFRKNKNLSLGDVVDSAKEGVAVLLKGLGLTDVKAVTDAITALKSIFADDKQPASTDENHSASV